MDDRLSLVRHYGRIWWQSNAMNFRTNTSSPIEFVSYIIAKTIRICFFFFFVYALFRNTQTLVGYSRGEVLLFCVFMNTIDISFQLFCRGLTTVPTMVRNGEYDTLLTKPVSPFFMSCFKLFDFMDLATLIPSVALVGLAIHELPYSLGASQILLAAVCWICSFLMAVALNVLIASLAFWVTEIENGIWIYRDLVYVGRFPPEIYPKGVQTFFTYVIPILLIVATPTKALIGKATTPMILTTLGMTIFLLLLSRFTWKRAIRRYASASA